MSTKKPDGSDRRYTEICGATNRNGEPCSLPAGWGTPGSGGSRCKYHGGCSTGPSDTSHLEDNNYAEGNPGGGAPEGNTNAEIHGGFADWEKAYERFDDGTREYVDHLIADMRERAKEHAPDVPEDRRERLLKEKATRSILQRRASFDVFASLDGEGPGRGLVIKADGERNSADRTNPAFEAKLQHTRRQREIAEELRLWPGHRDE